MPDPTFKARAAYVRAIRRGSRKHVTAEVFRATVAEAIRAIKPASRPVGAVESPREKFNREATADFIEAAK